MFSATKYVAAGLIVALFGGFLLSGVLTNQPDDDSPAAVTSPSTSPESTSAPPPGAFRLPNRIPDGIRSGQLKTALGPARWIHLQGAAQALPETLFPIAVPGGYVSIDEGNHTAAQKHAQLWFSPNLLKWKKKPLPARTERALITPADDGYWLVARNERTDDANALDAYDAASAWYSTDTQAWEQIELSSLTPPGPDALDWDLELGQIAVSDRTAVLPMTYRLRTMSALLDMPVEADDFAGLFEVEPGLYAVRGGYGEELVTLRFEETVDGLRVIDATDGTALTEIEGVGLEFIETWVAGAGAHGEHGALTEHRVGVIDDGEVVSVELPGMTPGGELAVFGSDAGLAVFRLGTDGTIQAWRSQDGVTWSQMDVIGDDPDEISGVGFIAAGPWGVMAMADGGRWDSSDGRTWKRNPAGAKVRATAFADGWLELTNNWLTIHGDEATASDRVNVKQLRLMGVNGLARFYGDSAIGTSRSQGGQRSHWIIWFSDQT